MPDNTTTATLQCTQTITLAGIDPSTTISFDLSKVKMTDEQRQIVTKLFSQNPKAVPAPDGHIAADEAGKPGPGSAYLTPDEFEKIRTLGVRLTGVDAPLGIIIDFCLHPFVQPNLAK